MTVITDDGTVFFSAVLPSHANRDMERGYFPAVNNNVLNKSKIYRVQFSSDKPFTLYSETRLEWLPWNSNQRESFRQFKVSSEMQLPVG